MPQLLLDLPVGVDDVAAAWLPTRATAEATRALALVGEGGVPAPLVCLYGPSGCGKTHVLAMALRCNPSWLVVDDVDGLGALGQEQLFHDFQARQGLGVVVASRAPLAQLPLLPDLKSRLLTGLQVEMGLPDDAELRALLARWAVLRQLVLPDAVVDFLLLRAERNPKVLLGLLGRLDVLSLQEKRAVTVPLARRVLEV